MEFFREKCFLVITHSFHMHSCWFTSSTVTNVSVETLWLICTSPWWWIRQHLSLRERRQCRDTVTDLQDSKKSWGQKKKLKSQFQNSVTPSFLQPLKKALKNSTWLNIVFKHGKSEVEGGKNPSIYKAKNVRTGKTGL